MSLKFCSIASGSKGNCYLIKTEKTTVLLDVGISGKKIFNAMELALSQPEDVDAVLISHEHTDHSKSVRIVMKKALNATLYSTLGTWEKIAELAPSDRQVVIESGKSFTVGDIEITPFHVHHDVDEPVGYTFKNSSRQLSIVTDTGHICDNIFDEIKGADALVIESNHEPRIVEMCSYPYTIKRRILSDTGHLSNEAAAICIGKILQSLPKPRLILLAHLSQENNTPDMAEMTVRNLLFDQGINIPVDVKIGVLKQNSQSAVFDV
ncbi:MAG: MBL fold metallo-hydrolase [Anaerovoracaceae bacterium]